MLTYNRRPYTQRKLENYERQIGSDDRFHFHVLDNGSADDTVEYLKNYNGPLNLDVIFRGENLGIADGTKLLLKKRCFGKKYDFIMKADDDLLMPDGWDRIFDHWKDIEQKDAVFVGFKLEECNQYFEGYKWVATNPENMKMIPLGDFECYRSYFSNGIQISTQVWWQKVYPYLSDLGLLYGGWDYTLLFALKKFRKWCFVVYNYEIKDLQNSSDYKEFNQFKNERIKMFQNKFDGLEETAAEYWGKLIKRLRDADRKDTNNPGILKSLIMAYELKGNEKLVKHYKDKLKKIDDEKR